jgi:hypothetical protein
MVKVYCIDDTNKPPIIPPTNWVERSKQYHIIHIGFTKGKGASKVHGCLLKELTIPASAYPYEAYKMSRFAVDIKDLPALLQLAMDCTQLSELDVSTLLQEELLEVIHEH